MRRARSFVQHLTVAVALVLGATPLAASEADAIMPPPGMGRYAMILWQPWDVDCPVRDGHGEPADDEHYSRRNDAAVVSDSNSMNHIFGNPRPKLDGLVRAFGSPDKLVAVSRAVLSAGKLQTDAKGVFSVVVRIGGQNVKVRGVVMKDGIRIADFWVN